MNEASSKYLPMNHHVVYPTLFESKPCQKKAATGMYKSSRESRGPAFQDHSDIFQHSLKCSNIVPKRKGHCAARSDRDAAVTIKT